MTSRGEFRVDMHVKVLDERVVRRAKERDLDALVYAPHFTRLPEIERRAAAYSDEDLLVIPAREIFTGSWQDRRHVLGVGLTDPIPDFITLEAAMAELDRQGAAVLVPHPTFATVSLDGSQISHYEGVIDDVEVYNPKHLSWHNRNARRLARQYDYGGFTSSYAHLRGTVGEAWTAFEDRIEDAAALVSALKAGAPRTISHREGLRHELRCKVEVTHLLYENTWKKVDRLLLQGTEPTHPRHLAYEGTFDDVSVY